MITSDVQFVFFFEFPLRGMEGKEMQIKFKLIIYNDLNC